MNPGNTAARIRAFVNANVGCLIETVRTAMADTGMTSKQLNQAMRQMRKRGLLVGKVNAAGRVELHPGRKPLRDIPLTVEELKARRSEQKRAWYAARNERDRLARAARGLKPMGRPAKPKAAPAPKSDPRAALRAMVGRLLTGSTPPQKPAPKPAHVETVEEFIARCGRIEVLPSTTVPYTSRPVRECRRGAAHA